MRINAGDLDEAEINRERILEENFGDRPPKNRRRNRGCKKTCGCLILAAIIIIIIVYATVRLAIGPVRENINALPADFPSNFTLYQVENAKIQRQNPESRDKILKILKATPDWLLKPIWSYLSNSAKNKLAENFNQNILPQNFSVADFKNLLNSDNLNQAKNISLSWQDLDKTKEEMLAYYKQELAKLGYQYKESLGDYQIDLSFWQENIFGQMSFSDEQNTSSKSMMEMMINYIK